MVTLIAARDASSLPATKFELDELGVIMPHPHDNTTLNGNLPAIYWNAAASMFAYLFVNLAPLGVEVLGSSQLAASPPIPAWGIPLPMDPSVSMIDWTSG